MATSAICGRSCSFTVGGESYDGHNVSLQVAGNETDVTAFGAGDFGDWLICGANGTVTAGFYDNLVGVLSIGDQVSLILTLGYTAPVVVTIASVVQSFGVDADAKGIVMQTATFRLTGDISLGGTGGGD